MGTLLQRKVTNESLENSLQDAIFENSYQSIKGLIGKSREIGFERERVISNLHGMLLGHLKEDYHAASHRYIKNSFLIIKRLNQERVLPEKLREGLSRGVRSSLNRNLERAWEVSRKESKGEMGIKLGISLGVSDFVERLQNAQLSGILSGKETAEYVDKAMRICSRWINEGKIPEFADFAKELHRHALVSKSFLKQEFGALVLERLNGAGSERFYSSGDKKNPAVARELNTWHAQNDLNALMEIGILERDDALRIMRVYASKGIIDSFRIAPQGREKSTLADAVIERDLGKIAKLSKR
ncbi:MAG: hypothetical protein KGH65_00375 [Candidatus Micrarchaeota archaeon]|nr:hypothetical protein [Candidatus Micrarchaeota archaeon]